MAKEIVWDSLTPSEAETLAALVNSGREVYAAPIEIETDKELREGQFASLGITWSQVRTWYIGSEEVKVHLTPADAETYKFLVNELRSRHRDEYRAKRCLIPGKQKPLIRCPDCNSCRSCPYPDYRDKHQSNQISWDELADSGVEPEGYDRTVERLHAKLEYDEIRQQMIAEDPKVALAFEMKERDGMTVAEISKALGVKDRQVYYLLQKAKAIGAAYKKD